MYTKDLFKNEIGVYVEGIACVEDGRVDVVHVV